MELTKVGLKRSTAICATTLTAAGVSLGLVACGGSSTESGTASASEAAAVGSTGTPRSTGTTGTTGSTGSPGQPAGVPDGAPAGGPAGGPPGGPMAELTDTQAQCLEDEGVAAPQPPKSGGTPGEAPQGTPPDLEKMQAAAEACDIEMPEAPSGSEMPQGAPGTPGVS